jgi:monoamine oxidase
VIDFSSASENRFILDGKLKTETDLGADSDFQAAKNFLNQLSGFSGQSSSVDQVVQAQGISSRLYATLNGQLGNRNGTSNDRLGVKGIAEAASLRTHDAKLLTLSLNPMDAVVSSRFSNVLSKVKYKTVVKSIDYSGDIITVTDQNNTTMSFNKVIVTVPVSVLKSGDITFSPPLPGEKLSSLDRMAMDNMIRVILDFKQNIWGNNTAFIYGGEKGPEYFSTGLGRSQFNKTLSATISGSNAMSFSVSALLAELNTVVDVTNNIRLDDSNVPQPIVVIKDWSKEPFIRGGSSYLKPGGSTQDRVALGVAVNNKLFFAGEATDSTGDAGTVSGALLSAERAAQEVITAIVTA